MKDHIVRVTYGDEQLVCLLPADYDALAERLAEAERLLREILRYPVDGTDLGEEVATFLRAADNGPPALCGHDDSSYCDEECKRKAEAFKKWHADSGDVRTCVVKPTETRPPLEFEQPAVSGSAVAGTVGRALVCGTPQYPHQYPFDLDAPCIHCGHKRTADSAPARRPAYVADELAEPLAPSACPECLNVGEHKMSCSHSDAKGLRLTADSAPACDHRGHPDWIPVPKPAVAAAKKFCTDCGQYLRPPETAAYGYSLDTEVCWHGEPKALCPQCAGDQWMIPAGKPEAWGAANDQEALLHAIEACTRSRPNDGRRWAMWPAETI